jgi:hypothetical protein
MRYSSGRKYPITQLKKGVQTKNQERVLDLSIATAAGLLALVFAEGLILGYICHKHPNKWK